MKLMSESIRDYISVKYEVVDDNDFNKVRDLVINRYDYSLNDVYFNSKELSYFTNLESCTFTNFEINDEIVENLNKLNLKELILNNCILKSNNVINVEKIVISFSNVDLKKFKNIKELIILECGKVNIGDIIGNDLDELKILNCEIINSKMLCKFETCDIEITGCKLDDESIKELDNVVYESRRYDKVL